MELLGVLTNRISPKVPLNFPSTWNYRAGYYWSATVSRKKSRRWFGFIRKQRVEEKEYSVKKKTESEKYRENWAAVGNWQIAYQHESHAIQYVRYWPGFCRPLNTPESSTTPREASVDTKYIEPPRGAALEGEFVVNLATRSLRQAPCAKESHGNCQYCLARSRPKTICVKMRTSKHPSSAYVSPLFALGDQFDRRCRLQVLRLAIRSLGIYMHVLTMYTIYILYEYSEPGGNYLLDI